MCADWAKFLCRSTKSGDWDLRTNREGDPIDIMESFKDEPGPLALFEQLQQIPDFRRIIEKVAADAEALALFAD